MTDYYWIAVYGEEDYLKQYNDDGTENSYGDIDRERITEFHLRDKETNRTAIAIEIPENGRLVWRRRNSMSGVDGQLNWTIHLVGWQETVNDHNFQSLNWVFPDGSIVNTGRFKDSHPIFYSVQYFDFE